MKGLRPRITRRVLGAVVAVVLYCAVALALVVVLPDSSWPPIGDDGFSAGQATVVPALNVFAVGIGLLAIVRPLLHRVLAAISEVAIGIGASCAGPALAIVGAEGRAEGLLTPGTLILAAAGLVIVAGAALVSGRAGVAGSSQPG